MNGDCKSGSQIYHSVLLRSVHRDADEARPIFLSLRVSQREDGSYNLENAAHPCTNYTVVLSHTDRFVAVETLENMKRSLLAGGWKICDPKALVETPPEPINLRERYAQLAGLSNKKTPSASDNETNAQKPEGPAIIFPFPSTGRALKL
jgi:hypothetical protein